ncbi:44033_t:CDS:2 [Gigaspora margarita]|uniref:44033_t:CDS:1 n=1 Tax=Gigaspora margarita TaxID=4874 RepID=A0ABN7UYR8_GIGMA|nr:44033_t:CDS:2 [Gigaspora margarita]
MVIRKLRSINKEINDVYGYSTSQLSNYPTLINKKVISSVVRRIIWYPLVPLVTQFSNSSVETYAYFYRVVSYPLLLLCVIGMSLQGLLNALASTQDIAVTNAFQAVKLQLWISNVNSYEDHYPHRSHNKGIIDEFSMQRKSNNFIELKVLQPSFLEWLSYMLLIKLFSVPKNSSRFSSPGHSLIIDSFDGKKTNNSSTFFGMDNLKQDVTLDNQNEDQDIHLAYLDPVHLKDYSQLNLLSHCLYPSTSSDPLIGSSRSNTININNLCTPLNSTTNIIDNDEGRIDINSESVKGVSKESTIRVSKESIKRFGSDIDISQEMETFKLMLKRL